MRLTEVRQKVADRKSRWHRATPAAAALCLAAAACSGNPSPETAPSASADGAAADSAASADTVTEDSLRSAAREEGVEEERVVEADREARRAVDDLDRDAREEFRELFGPDPLGLAKVPANAARYEIALETNRSVEWWIDRFRTEISDRFEIYLHRAGRYEDLIRSRLRDEGLPQDLLYLAMIESGMNPDAYSRAHAVGLWQFIASTARRYGLEVSYWVDERRDPIKATDAAIRYLSDLYDEFGSWYLAAAAYNGGEGRIRWGISHTGSEDYWDLVDARVLRRETRNYVPKLVAAALIARSPEQYGFDGVEPAERLAYDVVTVPDATSLDVIADAAGVSERSVDRLNPQFRRNVTPPGRETEVRVPAGTAATFRENYAEIPDSERVSWLVHTVTRGQTLSHIAGRYGASVRAIRAANDGLSPRSLQVGQRLVVPRMGQHDGRSGAGQAPAASAGPTTVVVRRGDTLWTIARRHEVSTSQLMQWNGLQSATIRPGDRIEVRR
ncbi:MAG: transglycosylase SLT domain-containing protein [Gemmatimonadota bacterium]